MYSRYSADARYEGEGASTSRRTGQAEVIERPGVVGAILHGLDTLIRFRDSKRPLLPLHRSPFDRLRTGPGSVGAILQNDGTLVGELLRYEPFGDARGTQPGSAITDRGFTGHRENRDIGLTYMNARYYGSYI